MSHFFNLFCSGRNCRDADVSFIFTYQYGQNVNHVYNYKFIYLNKQMTLVCYFSTPNKMLLLVCGMLAMMPFVIK